MLCPEVWKFPPPDSCNRETTGFVKKEETHLPPPLNNFYFCHSISVVLPNFEELRSITKSFNEDFQYYKIDNISLDNICSKDFITHFVKTGSLTALSINTRIDIDNSACVTPEGVLVLSLFKKTYQETGIEGKLSYFSKHTEDRYIIQINLKDASLTTNTTRYQKLRQSLRKLQFDLILIWEPPAKDICPSSIAKYLYNLGFNIRVCTPKFEPRICKNVKMPIIMKDKDDLSTNDLVEWLGMFALEADIDQESSDLYTNMYEPPENKMNVDEVVYLEWKGMFTVNQVQKLYKNIIKHLPNFKDIPWISLYVHGFSDVPVSWNMKEHYFLTNGDNGYILFLQPSGEYLLYTKSCSNKIHK